MSKLGMAFALLAVFQAKHFLADYPLQGAYMLRKFHTDAKVWVPALAAHAGVHALFTALIALAVVGFGWLAAGLAALDFTVHFTMDRIKASPNLLGRFKALTAKEWPLASQDAKRGNTFFWWSLGLDQMVHHLTHYLVIALLLA